jgi:hypothetical protein
MVDDLLSVIYEAEACGLISGLIEHVLESAVDPRVPHRYGRDLLQLSAYARRRPTAGVCRTGRIFSKAIRPQFVSFRQ